jgi:peptide/nickel transport system permease protein
VTAYVSRRGLQAVVVLLIVTLIVFGLLSLAPGSPATVSLGSGSAHSSFLHAYLTWLGRAVQGNLGFSARLNVSVTSLLAASLPRTLVLTGASTVLALVIAIPVGLLQAVRRGTVTDHVLRGLTMLCYGTPAIVLGSVLVLFLAVDPPHVFGAEGPQAPGIAAVITDVRDMALPVCTLTLVSIGIFARYMRSSALDSLSQDYVMAARARGAGERRVILAHVLRNSLVPVVTLLGLSLPQIVGGAVLVEGLFNIKGMGWQLWQAALRQDVPVTLGFTLVIAAAAVLGSLLADVAYAFLDPRVRHALS